VLINVGSRWSMILWFMARLAQHSLENAKKPKLVILLFAKLTIYDNAKMPNRQC
jgi:hypothetical protein